MTVKSVIAEVKAIGDGEKAEFEAAPAVNFINGTGLVHAGPMMTSVPRGLDYLMARFNDVPAPTN